MAIQTFPADKTLLVTGAGSPKGIGRATAVRFASEDWSIAALDLDGTAAEDLASELANRYKVRTLGVQADVSDAQSIDAAVTSVENELPPVVALVNSAGISDPTSFFEMDVDRWKRVIDINATGTFQVTHRVARGMVDRGVGRIVSISSSAAQNGGGNYSKSAYAASKAAIVGMSRSIALEFAPHGVTVNTISPATINTDIMGGPLTEDRLPDFLSRVPVGRVGEVSEVAGLLYYLCSEEAGYITGANYNINGGHYIG